MSMVKVLLICGIINDSLVSYMEFEDTFSLDHLLFTERRCRTCGITKDLLSEFYRTRSNRTTPSAYSYECKECTKIRVKSKRRKNKPELYPDW